MNRSNAESDSTQLYEPGVFALALGLLQT